MKLLKNFYQVAGPSLSHGFDAAAYLVKDEKGYYMIDCGTPQGYAQIVENIRSLGIDPKEIHTILATHGHYDHVGAANLWRRDFGCRLLVHPVDQPQVEQGDSELTSASLLYGVEAEPTFVDGNLEDGVVFPVEGGTLEVMHTPGHTKGSVSLVMTRGEETVLIAGDTIWGGFSAKIGSDEALWRVSLARITARHYDYYTFGHIGPQLLADADTRLKEAQMQFANYYNPWFRRFDHHYRY